MTASNSLYLKLALMHLSVGSERLRKLAFDPAKHPRGKTTPRSRGGSFSPWKPDMHKGENLSLYNQRAWTERLAAVLEVDIGTARQLMAGAEADMAGAGQAEANYSDIFQLAADRGSLHR